MKGMKRLLALIMTVFMFASMNTALAVDDGYPSTYTYNYDYWGDIRESPDAYRVAEVIYSGENFVIVRSDAPADKESIRIRVGDEVIVAARGLYDGKVVG